MEDLAFVHEKLRQALLTLQDAIVEIDQTKSFALATHKDQQKIYRTYRDSLIQRFEFSFDLYWKYLKKYLDFYGKKPAVISPVTVFRACFSAALLNEQEATLALEMIEDRNLTAHTYHEQLAQKISTKIPQYYNLMNTTCMRMQPE